MQFADSTQNHKRMIGTPNQTNQNVNFLKKSMFSTLDGWMEVQWVE
jgi:hypothetical protein